MDAVMEQKLIAAGAMIFGLILIIISIIMWN